MATLLDQIRSKVAEVADIDVGEIGDDTTLEALGLDSADAVIIAMEVEDLTSREIDVGVFLRCATIVEAAAEIARLVEND